MYRAGISADHPDYEEYLTDALARSMLTSAGTVFANKFGLRMGALGMARLSNLGPPEAYAAVVQMGAHAERSV